MEQLHSYLWTESFPLVYVLAFVTMIETGVFAFVIANRFLKKSILSWFINPLPLPFLFFLIVMVAKTTVGCTLLLGTTITIYALFLMIIHFYVSSEKFRNWFDNKQQESTVCEP